MATPLISLKATNLIVRFEVSSHSEYDAKYQRPTWPGGESGVTVGIGYDLGYCDLDKLHEDFHGRISDTMLRVMQRCLGITGAQAQITLPSVRNLILIPWDVAYAVFCERDIPVWTARVCAALPHADKLPSDCLGALVSLAYNRGASFDEEGDRRAEMRAIKAHMASGNLAAIPGDIRAMKRLWPDVAGLRDRRDKEADLFASGLSARSAPPVSPPDAPKAIPRSPPDVPPVPQSERRSPWLSVFAKAFLILFTKGK